MGSFLIESSRQCQTFGFNFSMSSLVYQHYFLHISRSSSYHIIGRISSGAERVDCCCMALIPKLGNVRTNTDLPNNLTSIVSQFRPLYFLYFLYRYLYVVFDAFLCWIADILYILDHMVGANIPSQARTTAVRN